MTLDPNHTYAIVHDESDRACGISVDGIPVVLKSRRSRLQAVVAVARHNARLVDQAEATLARAQQELAWEADGRRLLAV